MRKMRALRKKNEKKVHKKNLYTSQLGNIEEKIKRKKYICAPYMKADFSLSRLLVAPESLSTLPIVAAPSYYHHSDSAYMWF